ncbi:serine--tRNA ligase [Striga asiatica]|uniref:Serine--tRNA ligase n=1 Tax=Striga asiatica TaxID=4170 RepID=A0A5A7RJA8_STRAF|nr:serine--tRNA ligase [Striga asiatica]
MLAATNLSISTFSSLIRSNRANASRNLSFCTWAAITAFHMDPFFTGFDSKRSRARSTRPTRESPLINVVQDTSSLASRLSNAVFASSKSSNSEYMWIKLFWQYGSWPSPNFKTWACTCFPS